MGLSKNKTAILSIKSPTCVDDYTMSINSLSTPSPLQQMILASVFKSQDQDVGIHSVICFSVCSSGSA